MTKLITAQNLSLGWLQALDHLILCGGRDTNVMVVIEQIEKEVADIREELDMFLSQQKKRAYSVNTVANTIFPRAFYRPARGQEARSFLYQMYEEQFFPVIKKWSANSHGTYFHRMISWSGMHGTVNQLENVILKLKKELGRPNTKSSIYEIGISTAEEEEQDSYMHELRIYQPETDRTSVVGFPCLSHISLTLLKGRLHLTALYRNQHFIHRAYGNYLGLSRLLAFLCQETACEPGELSCIASHADAELSLGKRAITDLVQSCKVSLARPSEVEQEGAKV